MTGIFSFRSLFQHHCLSLRPPLKPCLQLNPPHLLTLLAFSWRLSPLRSSYGLHIMVIVCLSSQLACKLHESEIIFFLSVLISSISKNTGIHRGCVNICWKNRNNTKSAPWHSTHQYIMSLNSFIASTTPEGRWCCYSVLQMRKLKHREAKSLG